MSRKFVLMALLMVLLAKPGVVQAVPRAGQTYYVSSSTGDDDNNGLSEAEPFATVSKVNGLDLQPGDSVLFKCGDVWRADPLIITRSGTTEAPITFGTYPSGCADKPVLSGAQPIAGWSLSSGNVYVANLETGANAGKFAYGVNQLFCDDARLPMGRWPNLDEGDAGYSTIDGYSGSQITDNELPSGDWT
ncbi:MAG: glycoside hydrolase, partial [Anaerolineae bacterium]